MRNVDAVQRIEAVFGINLPPDYRSFLIGHVNSHLEPALEFSLGANAPGGNGVVDGLHTAAQILENEERQASCDADEKMLIVGYSLIGGYLYLGYAPERFGQIFFREPYIAKTYFPVAGSFSEFLANATPVQDDV